MRAGLITSGCLHVVLLAWGIVAFPSADPFEVDAVDALPVELVTLAELTKLREGTETAPDREVQVPRQVDIPKEPEPEPEVEPEPPGVNETPQETPPTETVSDVAALPQPSPEPEPEPQPEPDQKVEPEPVPQAEPDPAPVEPEPVAEEAPKPAPVSVKPRTKPKRPKKVAEVEKKTIADEVAAVIDKAQPSGGGKQKPQQEASLGTRRGNDNARLSQNELDGLRARIAECWSPPVGAIEAEDLKVLIQFRLRRDGSVESPPRVLNSSNKPFFRQAADSARRAILRCGPYTLPADKYDAWQDVKVTFDPREMFGG